MRMLLILIGVLLFSQDAAALSTPPRPPVLSKYAEGVLQRIEEYLSAASWRSDSGLPGTCDQIQSEAEEAEALRTMLFDVQSSTVEASQDFVRSPCFRSDAEVLEHYLRDLFDLALESARSCDLVAAGHYETGVEYVWSRLSALRRFGLDPRTQDPASGEEVVGIPLNASETDDDLLCPYDSLYASPPFGLLSPPLGCQATILPETASSFLQRESAITDRILQAGAALARDLPLIEKTVMNTLTSAALFVRDMGKLRPIPLPLLATPPALLPTSYTASGESGCLGWPSENGRIVTGEKVPLKNFVPAPLTQELREVLAYLQERERAPWLQYVKIINTSDDEDTGEVVDLYNSVLKDINRGHLGGESFSILSIRDPQKRLERIADSLHKSTREFVKLAVPSLGDSALSDGPLLRSFARKYATFLSRMCVNKGCGDILPRTFELSLRDECFSSFLMHRFFQSNPSASTLPACRALYVE